MAFVFEARLMHSGALVCSTVQRIMMIPATTHRPASSIELRCNVKALCTQNRK